MVDAYLAVYSRVVALEHERRHVEAHAR
jgi:hypothetical protein